MVHIHYYVHGHGRGHATGSVSIIEALRERGDAVSVFAGGEAWPVFVDQPDAYEVDSMMPGDRPLDSVKLLSRRVREAKRQATAAPPDCIVSDGDLPGVLVARRLRVPSIAVGHGVIFSHCKRPAGLPLLPWWREALKARATNMMTTRQVAVSFVPLEPLRHTTVVAALPGSIRKPSASRRTAKDGGVVCYFSGVDGREALRMLVSAGHTPTLFAREDPGIVGVDVRQIHTERFAEAVAGAGAVVSSAGSLLISECAGLGVPQYALYEPSHDEQRLNVAMLRRHEIGDGCPIGDVTRAGLTSFLDEAAAGSPFQRSLDWDPPKPADAVLRWVDELT